MIIDTMVTIIPIVTLLTNALIIVGFDNQDVLASDNDTTESGNAATNDVSEKSESDAAGNNKRPADDDGQVDKGKKAKKTLERDNDGVKYRIITRKKERNLFIEFVCLFIHRICLFVIKIFRLWLF